MPPDASDASADASDPDASTDTDASANEQLAQMVQARATTKTALEILATGNCPSHRPRRHAGPGAFKLPDRH